MAQRTTAQTLAWYIGHQSKAAIGFDPDGQCLKVCRSARNLPARYSSALAAQVATPKTKRVYEISNIKPGMVMFFDDPNDDNPYGHIVTVYAVAPIIKSLDDILVWTNSVQANVLTKVRASYFKQHWGDQFQFAATWLNGFDLLMPTAPKPPIGGAATHGLPRLHEIVVEMEDMIADHKKAGNTRIVTALERDKAELLQTIEQFKQK